MGTWHETENVFSCAELAKYGHNTCRMRNDDEELLYRNPNGNAFAFQVSFKGGWKDARISEFIITGGVLA